MTEKNHIQPPTGDPTNYGFQLPPPAYEPVQQQSHFHSQGQHQQQPYYAPQQGTQVVTVITNNAFGPESTQVMCPSCNQMVNTRIDFESSTKTHLMALVICLICWPCFWIPYAADSCKNANHLCPSCGAYLGSYRG